MNSTTFSYLDRFSSGLPEPSPRFTGFPTFNFIGGHNDPTQIPTAAMAAAAAAVIAREGSSLAMYNLGQGPMGYPALRDFVADKLGRHRGVTATREDVLITSGSGQGIDMVTRLLIEPGDTVLAEEFCYAGALTRIRRLGATIVPVPLDAQGMRVDRLAEILAGLKSRGIAPKFLYTIPTIQNPTGSILPLERRRQLLELARQYRLTVFEDECYADLIWAGGAPPSLYALDPSQVIHIGSFSKSLAPALRVGYALAGESVLSRLVACKTDGGTGALDQMVIAEYFSRHFDAHIASLSQVLGAKLDTMMAALEEQFGTALTMRRPDGGIFLWMKLPDAVDVTTLVKPAAAAGIVFNPGPEWACDGDAAKSYLRLCFALPSHAEIRAGIAAFARVCYEQAGIPAQSANIRHAG